MYMKQRGTIGHIQEKKKNTNTTAEKIGRQIKDQLGRKMEDYSQSPACDTIERHARR
jgi:hypothetical protein